MDDDDIFEGEGWVRYEDLGKVGVFHLLGERHPIIGEIRLAVMVGDQLINPEQVLRWGVLPKGGKSSDKRLPLQPRRWLMVRCPGEFWEEMAVKLGIEEFVDPLNQFDGFCTMLADELNMDEREFLSVYNADPSHTSLITGFSRFIAEEIDWDAAIMIAKGDAKRNEF